MKSSVGLILALLLLQSGTLICGYSLETLKNFIRCQHNGLPKVAKTLGYRINETYTIECNDTMMKDTFYAGTYLLQYCPTPAGLEDGRDDFRELLCKNQVGDGISISSIIYYHQLDRAILFITATSQCAEANNNNNIANQDCLPLTFDSRFNNLKCRVQTPCIPNNKSEEGCKRTVSRNCTYSCGLSTCTDPSATSNSVLTFPGPTSNLSNDTAILGKNVKLILVIVFPVAIITIAIILIASLTTVTAGIYFKQRK